MEYTKEQLDKLPKWAKIEINRLSRNNEILQNQLNEFSGKSETNIYLSYGLDKMPLQKGGHIEYVIGDNKWDKVSVYIRDDGSLDINASSNKTLAILPRASNSFYIKLIDRQ